MPLTTILRQTPATSVEEVIGVMMAIESELPLSDGLRWFNHLYLRVTLAVRASMTGAGLFADPVFMERLDVVFANLYFEAIAAGDTVPSAAPPAWRPLLAARFTPHLHPLQHALAGMNAHINRDLPAGIGAVFEELGGSPQPAGGRHEDFERVNGILEAVEAQVKVDFATGSVATIDELSGPIDDHLAMWSVRAARDTAWTNAQVLWALKPAPDLRRAFFERLDRFTGLAARGLLTRVAVVRT